MNPVCTICVLFCGDYLELVERCLTPLVGLDPSTFRMRIACNAVSARSKHKVLELVGKSQAGLVESVLFSDTNRYKYPMMRLLLNGGSGFDPGDKPIGTKWMLWLDDDSGISALDSQTRILDLIKEAEDAKADMLGSIWTMTLTNEQMEWVKTQPWFSGRPVSPRVAFCTGGFWLANTQILLDNKWPPQDCIHRGGDVMLGQLMYQKSRKIKTIKDKSGLLINAGPTGKECTSPHRVANFYPVGHKNANQPRPLDQP